MLHAKCLAAAAVYRIVIERHGEYMSLTVFAACH